jgi:peptide/nickel transport system substrate-binding protein
VLEAVRIPLPAITRYSAALGAAALLIAGISACSTSNSSSASSASSAATKPSTLTIATSFAIGDLDPIENGYWGNELGYGELLMKPQLDGTVKPWLLKSLTNPSPTTWVLLNSGIRFQDGKPLNAASLIACMEYQLKSSDSATGSALPGA